MTLKKMNIGVLSGGMDDERDISIRSAQAVFNALKSKGYKVNLFNVDADFLEALSAKSFDVLYNTLHGRFGEDGQLQAILDFKNIPYTGERRLPSSISFHKVKTKEILKAHYIETPESLTGLEHYENEKHLKERLSFKGLRFPLILKPVAGGSSLGVKLLPKEEDFDLHVGEIFRQKNEHAYFIETFVSGRELTVGVHDWKEGWNVLPLLEIKTQNDFYDYEAKYTPGMTELMIPASVPEVVQIKLEQTVLKIVDIFGFRQCVRIDCRLNEEGRIYVLEINTSPGMTETSDIPKMLEYEGIDLADFCAFQLKRALQARESRL